MNWYWTVGWLPSMFAIFGNAFVIFLICTRRKLKTNPNCFILSLALADFGVGACCFPVQFICNFFPSTCLGGVTEDIVVLMIYSSTTSLCTLTIDRYLAIVKPLTYTTLMTRTRVLHLIALSWLVTLMAYFVPALCTTLSGCTINQKVTVVIWTSLFEFIPCVVLFLVTVKIILTTTKHHRQLSNLDSQLRYNEPSYKCQRHRKMSTAHVIVTVVCIFLLCYSVEVYSSLCYFTSLCSVSEDLFHVVFFLVATNSAANPIAYALLKSDIQRELRNLCCIRTKSTTVTTKI